MRMCLWNQDNRLFLRYSIAPVWGLVTDPPWGAGTQNTGTPFQYTDYEKDMPTVVSDLASYAARCVLNAGYIACDDRWLSYWTAELRQRGFSTSNIVCKSELGNYSKSRPPNKHYYWVCFWRGDAPLFFNHDAYPIVDRMARPGSGEKKRAASVWDATMSNTDPERITGFQGQKQVWLLECLVKSIARNEEDVIVDPFMGTGTTGVACAKNEISFIGIEENANTFATAKERIENVHGR